MKVPVKNIYYLLCYAWDKLEEGKKIDVSYSEYDDLITLLGRVLINGCKLLFIRGLEHSYNEVTDEYVGVKGKIDIGISVRRRLFKQGKSVCTFDHFESNILTNQMIKATLRILFKMSHIDSTVRRQVKEYYLRFVGVDDIVLDGSAFEQVRIHRNNSFYDLLIKICKLIFQNSVLDQQGGQYTFKDFTGSQIEMGHLFESFVRNFYKKEQSVFAVKRENINWHVGEKSQSKKTMYELLPVMQTDITLESNTRKVIIETKFYFHTFSEKYGSKKINSNHIYQLFAYLKNIESSSSHLKNSVCEGIILYPLVDENVDATYQLSNHLVQVKTLNLNAEWREIRGNLLSICSQSTV